MARDIDVDAQDLQAFIIALCDFQERIDQKHKDLDKSWQKLDESWKGGRKDTFSKEFEETMMDVAKNLKQGGEALEWLLKYQQAVQELM